MLNRLLVTETRRSVTLVGHSRGGILALLFSCENPKVGQLVLRPPLRTSPVAARSATDRKLLLLRQLGSLPGDRQIVGMTPEQLVSKQLADATPHVRALSGRHHETTVAEVRADRLGA
jgi:pimeloyl-ACP methyl ester carboxylesterase